MNAFRAGYRFLEEKATEEVTQLRKIMQREQTGRSLGGRAGRRKRKLADEDLVELQRHLTRAEQYQADSRRHRQAAQAVSEHKKANKGQRYVPHAVKKQIALNQRFRDLEDRGRLDAFLNKKRRIVSTRLIRATDGGGGVGSGRGVIGPVLGV